MPVAVMLRSMPATELTEWRIFFAIEKEEHEERERLAAERDR